MFLYSAGILSLTLATKSLIHANQNDLIKALSTYLMAAKVVWWLGLNCDICYYISHWVFAFKYWTVAIKVGQLK